MAFRKIAPEELGENVFRLIGQEWMLVTASAGGTANPMTASWGGLGVLWGKPVAFVFIRPQRYTFGFAEQGSALTLSFLPESCREALRYCGSHSGRDGDKFAACGLMPVRTGEFVYPAESRLVLCCRKLYADNLREENFTDPAPLYTYADKDFHRMYVCQITDVLEQE